MSCWAKINYDLFICCWAKQKVGWFVWSKPPINITGINKVKKQKQAWLVMYPIYRSINVYIQLIPLTLVSTCCKADIENVAVLPVPDCALWQNYLNSYYYWLISIIINFRHSMTMLLQTADIFLSATYAVLVYININRGSEILFQSLGHININQNCICCWQKNISCLLFDIWLF